MSYDISHRTKIQMDYIRDLHEQAVKAGDVDKTLPVSNFMMGYYFKFGYDSAFNRYYNGEVHKLKWQGLDCKNIETKLETRGSWLR